MEERCEGLDHKIVGKVARHDQRVQGPPDAPAASLPLPEIGQLRECLGKKIMKCTNSI